MAAKTFALKGLILGVDWASDWKWDWTSDEGDQHSDFIAFSRCLRDGYPPMYRVALGPLALMVIFDKELWNG